MAKSRHALQHLASQIALFLALHSRACAMRASTHVVLCCVHARANLGASCRRESLAVRELFREDDGHSWVMVT